MKKIMILGATAYQVPLIKAAKNLGYYTIVASIAGNYPGFEIGDERCHVDITNPQEVLEKAKQHQIDGIATCCMDTGVKAIGVVCDAMNLVGLSEKAAFMSNNKYLMKEAFEKFGVNTAKYRKVATEGELKTVVQELQFPLIVKAVDLQASRGIVVVHDETELADGFRFAMDATKENFCIVEEFIVGEEFGAQAFVYDGNVEFVLPHGDYTFINQTALPVGHFAPMGFDDEKVAKIEEQCKLAIQAIGLNNCAVNIDMIYRDGKVYMIELTGRAGATCLAELVSIYFGINYYKMLALMAMGENPLEEFNKQADVKTANASKFIMANRSGVVKKIVNLNETTDDIFSINFHIKEGDTVKKFADGKDRLGEVITQGPTLEYCQKRLDEVLSKIIIEIDGEEGQ